MNMKSKVKSPEDAQELGIDGNKRLLKKLIKDGFEEPLKFFYDTAFDYGDKEEAGPVLFIADKIPASWKRYMKERKQERTFAAGNCLLTVEGMLKMVVETGKGGKASQLKEINKQLLRPFSSAFFVENLMSEEVQQDVEDKDSDFETEDLGLLAAQAQLLTAQGKKLQRLVAPLVKKWEKPLSDLKALKPDDNQIKEVDKAISVIQESGFQDYILRANAFANGFEEDAGRSKELGKALSDLKSILSELSTLQTGLILILTEGPKLSLVKNPMLSTYPPISKDLIVNFGNNLRSILGKTNLDEYAELLKRFE